MVRKIISWLKRHAETVPQELAVCEFDCRKEQCRLGEWQSCERRRWHESLYGSATAPLKRRPATG
jgi:hypothetical protein